MYRAKVKSDDPVISKRWAYGDKVTIGDRVFIVLDDAEYDKDGLSHGKYQEVISGFIEVIPESVGQSTGAKDGNGAEIYDGDMLDPHPDPTKVGYRKYIRTVEWDDYLMRWQAKFGDGSGEFLTTRICEQCEICSNVTDNPELLQDQAK